MDASKDVDVARLRHSMQLLTLALALAGAVMVVFGVVWAMFGVIDIKEGAGSETLLKCLVVLFYGVLLLAVRRCLLLLVKLFGRLVIATERQAELLEGEKPEEG